MSELRKSGIDILGDIPLGSHFCNFYETKQDLLDIMVPYFLAGFENNEFCLWVVSKSGLITVEEAKEALAKVIPDHIGHFSDWEIEILIETDWYLEEDAFNLEKVINGWKTKLNQALANGYNGMRVAGDTFWLTKNIWKDFFAYEREINDSIANLPITILCTYPLEKSGAAELLDVAHSHQFAITKRQGEWEVLETPKIHQAKAEIKKLNEELEQKVDERTHELSKSNNELLEQIVERKKAQDELQLAYQRLSYHVENTPLAVVEWDKNLFVERWSERAEEIFGWKASEAIGKNIYAADLPIIYKEDIPALNRIMEQLLNGIVDRNLNLIRDNTKNGAVIYCEWYNSVLRDEQGKVITILSLIHNVTERKIAEEKIRQSEAHLAEAQKLTKMGSWDYDIEQDKVTWSEELYNIFDTDKRTFRDSHGSFLHLIDEGDREFALQTSIHTQQTGEPFTMEYHITTAKGEKRVILEHGYGQKANNGDIVRLFGTAQDITEQKKGEEMLQQSFEEIRRLTEHLQKIRETERTHIAREIHDELGQHLTAMKMDVVWIDKKTPKEETDIKRKLANIITLLDISNQSIRRILDELRPRILEDHGLLEAIEWLGRQLTENTGIAVKFTTTEKDIKVSREIATSIYRICQEAFTNITRYAQAKIVSTSLIIIERNIVFTIEDDGIGFDMALAQKKRSFGILGMKERVLSLSGKFEMISSPGKGTKIKVSLPIGFEKNETNYYSR
jgi:PAS domain S-box-containing protein